MTPSQANDIMCGCVNAYAKAEGLLITFTDVDGDIGNGQVTWLRVNVKHATGGQSSLSDQNGKRRFRSTGTLTIQVFAPAGTGKGDSYLVSEGVLSAISALRDPDLSLTEIHLVDIGQDGSYYNVNVMATFSYDEVR